MKPFRVAMTNELVKNYGLYDKLDIYVFYMELKDNDFCDNHINENIDRIMVKFHSDDYIDLIKNVTPENKSLYSD
jgi:hypothetical protein